MVALMQSIIRFRGRNYGSAEIESIRQLIAAYPGLSRRRLSVQLCQAWHWVQPNGQPREMVARSLMLKLHRAGHIELPAKRVAPPNNATAHRRLSSAGAEWPLTTAPLDCSLSQLGPLEIRQVRRTAEEALFDRLLQAHHYLGYTRPVGEHLKHLVYGQAQPLACLAWSSAPRHLGPRDRFIGWSVVQRQAQVHLLAYNTRYLLLPWARVRQLASHVLGAVARVISADWQRLYHHPIYLLETFIDPERFRGTAYQAANWIYLGQSSGRGKDDLTHRANRSLKELWVYPLVADFRARLASAHE
jgi:Druantia protein DruA